METAGLSGKMAENMMGSGLKENNTEPVSIVIQKEKNVEENGKMEKEHNGLIERLNKFFVSLNYILILKLQLNFNSD